MFRFSKALGVLAVASICASQIPQSAVAAPIGQATVSSKIDYADLNLATRAGAGKMLLRIRNSAREVCGWTTSDSLFPYYRAAEAKCVKATIDKAVAGLNSPMLTALNEGRRPNTRALADSQ